MHSVELFVREEETFDIMNKTRKKRPTTAKVNECQNILNLIIMPRRRKRRESSFHCCITRLLLIQVDLLFFYKDRFDHFTRSLLLRCDPNQPPSSNKLLFDARRKRLPASSREFSFQSKPASSHTLFLVDATFSLTCSTVGCRKQ
jgi:hypothetical protein